MGLFNQLDSLYVTDIYQYMKGVHDGVKLGILLGRSAWKISSMEETLSRMLHLNILFKNLSTSEIATSMNTQSNVLSRIVLILMNTVNKLKTKMSLN